MRLFLLGFTREEDVKAAIEDFVMRQGVFLFTIVCGRGGLVEKVAREMGAPVEYAKGLAEVGCQWVIADLRSVGQEGKNWLMRYMKDGGHGSIWARGS